MTVNAYYTKWMDRTDRDTQRSAEIRTGANAGERYTINLENVQAQHIGLEVDFAYKPTKWFELQGMLSWGDWQWQNNAKGYFYNSLGQPLKTHRATSLPASRLKIMLGLSSTRKA